ncbi:sulfite exporter TauE/SafE family protein [Phormidium sp. CCY1219]|uniref:sulfite exporter TauE/SafE family protein n=1 Tax=Phormidium sp. CCY1219 TaxID=2886104 RepID=UPI002D1E928B|nr:sulfite exporter TauE/SafE family protein [Phormidium sp. CCY1219]MEB3831461.1 sulfite exporter TauE/SafE family protein [Phormidium sp. CCY1219]
MMNPEPMTWALLLLLGTCTGVLGGIFGLGGGFLLVPMLTLLGFPVIEAAATSLVGVFLTAFSGSLRNGWMGELNWRESAQIALFGIPMAQVGAWMGDRIPDAWLGLCFALLLLSGIYLMSLRQNLSDRQQLEEPSEEVEPPEKSVPRPWKFAQIGAIAGVMSGLFGIGGGLIIVPLHLLLIRESIQTAVVASLGAVVPIAASGLAQHAWNHRVLWMPGLCIGIGGMIGAQIGTRLLPKLSPSLVNRVYRLVLFGMALYMIGQSFVKGLV